MSDNLKRAESLFNRIMNQNADSSASSSPSSTPVQSFQTSFPPRSKFHHQHQSSNSSQVSDSVNFGSGQSSQPQSQHHTSSQQLANLPKLDVAKLTEEALATVSENDHVLPYCWTVWHHLRKKKQQQQQQGSVTITTEDAETVASTTTTKDDDSTSLQSQSQSQSQEQPGVDTYLQTTNRLQFTDLNNNSTTISHIASIEQMWTMLTSIKTSFNLNVGTEFLIFKIGVNPVWEDPLNAKGGRWIFRFSRRTQDYHHSSKRNVATDGPSAQLSVEKMRKRSALIWERIVIKILTGNFIPATHAPDLQNVLNNDICGIVLSVRKEEDIISVWNSNLNFKKQSQQSQQSSGVDAKKPLTPFQARRIICDAILRVIRECDEILLGADSIKTVDSGSNERVGGVGFEYRLHVESPSNMDNKGERKGRYGGGKYSRSNNSNNHHQSQQQQHQHHHQHNGSGSTESGDVINTD
ncbi:hypothetical protein KGF57_004884 [Candida theae]|uniref:Uncharacterized protein n=1 Tax=Candida theae TaxID=1198502 RepID=A0AAD5BB55_9ASCO|nr:uncharacterized protein KGF57_004884 [Candida theae]KAI5949054.1 hypothetical protein KGF57_004884 [Candida theae]